MPSSTFEERKSIATYWCNKASDLLGSAGLIWLGMQSEDKSNADKLDIPEWYSFKIACMPTYRMICGMAVESLIKAILVQRGEVPELSHDLNKLAKQASIYIDQETANLLKILSESVLWDGRYPVPKTEKHYLDMRRLERDALTYKVPLGPFHVLQQNGALDWENFQDVWNRIFDVYLAEGGGKIEMS